MRGVLKLVKPQIIFIVKMEVASFAMVSTVGLLPSGLDNFRLTMSNAL